MQIYWPLSVNETNDYKKNWALLFTEVDFVLVLLVFHNLITNSTIKSEHKVLKAVNLTVMDERQCVAMCGKHHKCKSDIQTALIWFRNLLLTQILKEILVTGLILPHKR